MSSLTSLQHGSGSLLEKIPTDRETWENEYKDYAEAEAADFIEFLEGIPDPPREETEDMSAEEKRDLATITSDYNKRRNQAWKFLHCILKGSHLKSYIKKYSNVKNRAYKAWTAITLAIKTLLNYNSYYNTN